MTNKSFRITKDDHSKLLCLQFDDVHQELSKQFPQLDISGIRNKCEELIDYCESKGKRYKNYLAFARNAIRKDQGNLPKKSVKYVPPKPKKEEKKLSEAERKKGLEIIDRFRKKYPIKTMEDPGELTTE